MKCAALLTMLTLCASLFTTSVMAERYTFLDTVYVTTVPQHKHIIGQRQVLVTVIFQTSKYNLDACQETQGFYVARREDNQKLQMYCGTDLERGDEFFIFVEQGI